MDFLISMSISLNLFVASPKSFRKALITAIGNLKIMYHTWALRDVRSKRKSLATLVISPYEQIDDVIIKLDSWILRYATEGKGRAVEALVLAQQILMNYRRVPKNGLIIYAGIVYNDDGAKVVAIGFEPFKLIYARSNRILDKFDMEALIKLLEPDNVITKAVGWVWNVITQAIQNFVLPLVKLVVESFVRLVDFVERWAAYSVQDHGWVQNVITQALRWVLIFVLLLVLMVSECFLWLMDLVVIGGIQCLRQWYYRQ